MYSKKSFAINTLSCNEGSMRLRPEWLWKARRWKKFLSWWVSTILKSFLVSSPFCHCTLPHFSRPMLRLHKTVPKNSFLISIIPSLHRLLEVDDHDEEKSTQLFWHWVSDWRIIFWLNISPLSFSNGKVLVEELPGLRLYGFALDFDRLAKASTFVFQRKIFELHLGGFLLVLVVLLVVAQVRDQLIQAMRNSDPRVRIPISTPF